MTKQELEGLIAHALRHIRNERRYDDRTINAVEEQFCRELHAASGEFNEMAFLTTADSPYGSKP